MAYTILNKVKVLNLIHLCKKNKKTKLLKTSSVNKAKH